jgi:nucleotidyltransferase substrate binding protein (TIGR01987 family)
MTPTADIRWQQRLSNFDRALALLGAALIDGPAALNQLEKEGVIQRFEYCFELAWKTTKDYIEANGFLFAVVMPRQVLKEAYAAHRQYLPAMEQLFSFLQQEATA